MDAWRRLEKIAMGDVLMIEKQEPSIKTKFIYESATQPEMEKKRIESIKNAKKEKIKITIILVGLIFFVIVFFVLSILQFHYSGLGIFIVCITALTIPSVSLILLLILNEKEISELQTTNVRITEDGVQIISYWKRPRQTHLPFEEILSIERVTIQPGKECLILKHTNENRHNPPICILEEWVPDIVEFENIVRRELSNWSKSLSSKDK